MQFTIPTTKEQMNSTLQEIFYFYRIRRQSLEEVSLKPLELEKIQKVTLTLEQIQEKANLLVTPEVEQLKQKEKQKLQLEINKINLQQSILANKKESAVAEVHKVYQERILRVEEQAYANGTQNSSAVVFEINRLTTEKEEKAQELALEYEVQITALQGQESAINDYIEHLDDFYQELKAQKVNKKVEELKQEQEKELMEIDKFNLGVEERIQKYANSIIRQKADIEIKRQQLNGQFFTKDQLIEMGYYNDVITCITGYYDSLSPQLAKQEFIKDKEAMIYLEEYYDTLGLENPSLKNKANEKQGDFEVVGFWFKKKK